MRLVDVVNVIDGVLRELEGERTEGKVSEEQYDVAFWRLQTVKTRVLRQAQEEGCSLEQFCSENI